MEPKIIFEDDQILAIDKPAGMVVNTAQSVKEKTVQEWVARNFQFPISNDQTLRNGVVHRIDKETSGILLIAKTPEAFSNLQKQFKARVVEKVYLALVHAKVVPPTGTIKAPVGRLPWNRERFGVLAGGRAAETSFEVASYYRLSTTKPTTYYTLLNLMPKTGRTHQIRVHLKSLGHPIVGDEFYAGRKTARQDRTWCPRLFLHAAEISFTHPETGKRLTFEAPLPVELKEALEKVEQVE